MDEETKKALTEAKANPTPENIAKAEEKICQNGANNNLDNLITKTLNRLKKGNLTKKEKEEIAREILTFITSENKYKKNAFLKRQPEVNALLAELKKENDNQENHQLP